MGQVAVKKDRSRTLSSLFKFLEKGRLPLSPHPGPFTSTFNKDRSPPTWPIRVGGHPILRQPRGGARGRLRLEERRVELGLPPVRAGLPALTL